MHKSAQGKITLAEYEIGRLTSYYPTTNTIEINEQASIPEPGDESNVAEIWLKRIDRQKGMGAQISYSETLLDVKQPRS